MNGHDEQGMAAYGPQNEAEYLMSQYDDADYFAEWMAHEDAESDAVDCPYCGNGMVHRGSWYCDDCGEYFPNLDEIRALVDEVAR